MNGAIDLEILTQPSDVTCGPTCLHAVYRHFGIDCSLESVIDEVPSLDGGGTLGVLLANDALRRGFSARLYTYNLDVFDPTWFAPGASAIGENLASRIAAKAHDDRLVLAAGAYLTFLDLGGDLRFEDMSRDLIRNILKRGLPILTGVSATYLHRAPREISLGHRQIENDLEGDPQGHFVVLCGYDSDSKEVLVADPLHPNPLVPARKYRVHIDRVIAAVLLGVITYDANILILQPQGEPRAHRRQ